MPYKQKKEDLLYQEFEEQLLSMETKLTPLQGFNIMDKVLDNYYQKTKSDDIGSLLSVMSFLSDECTADPAIWEDWIEAIKNKKTLTKQEAFEGIIQFLEIYYSLTSSNDTKALIDELSSAKNCNDIQIPIVKKWNLYFQETMHDTNNSPRYLELTKK